MEAGWQGEGEEEAHRQLEGEEPQCSRTTQDPVGERRKRREISEERGSVVCELATI